MSETSVQLFNGTDGTKCNESEMAFTLMLTMSLPSQLISLLGLAGNGTVIWFLGFTIQRNPFTIYLLNLALADFLLLLCASVGLLYILIKPCSVFFISSEDFVFYIHTFFIFGNNTSVCILTFVSVERCISVQYPLWYKCHRPTHLTSIACAFTWTFAVVMVIIECFLCTWEMHAKGASQCTAVMMFLLFCSCGVFVPIMIACSVLVMIIVKNSSKQNQPMRLYRVILLNILVFLITTLIPKLLDNLYYFQIIKRNNFNFKVVLYVDIFFNTLNSSANPYIYFLVGKSNKIKHIGSIRRAIYRVFQNVHEASCAESSLNKTVFLSGD